MCKLTLFATSQEYIKHLADAICNNYTIIACMSRQILWVCILFVGIIRGLLYLYFQRLKNYCELIIIIFLLGVFSFNESEME